MKCIKSNRRRCCVSEFSKIRSALLGTHLLILSLAWNVVDSVKMDHSQMETKAMVSKFQFQNCNHFQEAFLRPNIFIDVLGIGFLKTAYRYLVSLKKVSVRLLKIKFFVLAIISFTREMVPVCKFKQEFYQILLNKTKTLLEKWF